MCLRLPGIRRIQSAHQPRRPRDLGADAARRGHLRDLSPARPLFPRAGIRQEQGTAFCGIRTPFTKTSNDRECGWLCIKELLAGGEGEARLRIFSSCTELLRCLPALTVDKIRPTDCANEPHEITHAPDALRGFAIYYARPAAEGVPRHSRVWSADMWEDYRHAGEEERSYLIKKYGEPE